MLIQIEMCKVIVISSLVGNSGNEYFLSARSPSGWTETECQNFVCFSVCLTVCLSAIISSSSSIPSSLEEGSSQTCVGVVPRDLSLCDIMSGIR